MATATVLQVTDGHIMGLCLHLKSRFDDVASCKVDWSALATAKLRMLQMSQLSIELPPWLGPAMKLALPCLRWLQIDSCALVPSLDLQVGYCFLA
jgi:hypothetical protein